MEDNTSMLKWWRSFRESLRAASRIGRVFGLRDRGRLDEALEQALSLADADSSAELSFSRPGLN